MNSSDHQSLEQLFRQEFPRLLRSLSAVYGKEVAQDSLQEAFEAAQRSWMKVGRYDDPAGWLRQVALRRARNRVRNQRRRQAILRQWGTAETARARPPLEPKPEHIDLHRAIAHLPQQMQLCVALHYLADLPVVDVANALDISQGTVKSNLHDARRRLRSGYAEHDRAELSARKDSH